MVSLATPSNFARSWKREGAGRTLTSTYKKLGFSLPASRSLSRATKIALAPTKYFSRKAARLPTASIHVSKTLDYTFLTHEQIPGLAVVKRHCESMFERDKQEILASTDIPHSLFKYRRSSEGPSVIQTDDMRPIVDFLSQPQLVEMAREYIGEMPVLGNICLWYTRTTSQRKSAQLIHRDMNCRRQLHIVIPIRPVDLGTGPFTFLPGNESRKIVNATQHSVGRIEDEQFFKMVSPNRLIAFTSDKGAALVINPYACFHFGGRAETSPRFVLICSYTSLFENAEEGLGTYRLTNRAELSDGSFMKNKLLNL